MDISIRFWDDLAGEAITRYLTPDFLNNKMQARSLGNF